MRIRPAFDEMAKIVPKLNASAGASHLMEAFSRVIQFSVPGEGAPFFVRIENGQIQMHDATANDPDLVINISDAARFIDVLRGGLDISHPVAEGRLTVERGKLSEMVLFNRILAAAQKGKKQ